MQTGNKILVLGYFGYNTNQLDGQTVKTRDVYRLTKEQTNDMVDYYDTEDFKYHKLSILKMFWKIVQCKQLFYLPAHNNLKSIFPVIYCLSVLFRFQIHYFVVGGWLGEFIKELPVHRYMLSRIAGIHVETEKLREDLVSLYHYSNVTLFPNFRFFNYNEEEFINCLSNRQSNTAILKMAFVSRVDQSKGLDTLVRVADILNQRNLLSCISIDFYGQKKDTYYDSYLIGIPSYTYKGELQPNDVINMLGKYDALIFPTHYEGEGCPGILIEALAAGLPIVASDWKYNNEFIDNGENGFLCETFNPEAYADAIQTLLFNTNFRVQMAKLSYKKSAFFSSINAEKIINDILKQR